MPRCFVPAFQGKERSENTERKVSTALFLHGDCFFFCFLQRRQWGLGIWSLSCFAQQTDSHSQSSAPSLSFRHFFLFLCCCCFFTKLILHRRLKVFATCIQTHKTLHFDNISWTSQHYMRLACTSQVINMGNTSFRWMNDTWWGHCPLYLPFIPLLPFFYLCYTFPFFLSFFPFNVYIPLNSVCSFYWLLWNR